MLKSLKRRLKITKPLRKFDQFGKPFTLSIDGQEKFNTLIGVLFTIVVMTLFLVLFANK